MIRRFLFVSFLFFMSQLFVFAFSEDELSYLEISKYGQTYEKDSFYQRLSRLENDILGMTQSGDIDNRIRLLYKVSSNSIAFPQEKTYEVNKKTAIRNLWDNISSGFINNDGFMTGYIPSMNYSDNYMDFFDNEPQYCPYHNTYHHQSRRVPRIGRHNFHHNHHHHPSSYNPYGPTYQRPTYGRTSVATGSTVRIINDWFYKIKKRTLFKFSL